MLIVLKNAFTFDPNKTKLNTVLGNNIIMDCDHQVFALFAHLQKGSITVEPGEYVKKGQILGKVGHSGNSTAPHLHFHLMDNSDLLTANGIPCAFEKYEVLRDGQWQPIIHGMPSSEDRFRFNG